MALAAYSFLAPGRPQKVCLYARTGELCRKQVCADEHCPAIAKHAALMRDWACNCGFVNYAHHWNTRCFRCKADIAPYR